MLLLLTIIFCSYLTATLAREFSNYSECARSCILKQRAVKDCRTDDVHSTNICLCGDVTYQKSCATCIYEACGKSVLEQTAHISNQNCQRSGTPLAISPQDFIRAGVGDDVDTKKGGGAMSVGERVGIALAAVFGTLAIVIATMQLLATLEWIDKRWRPFPLLWARCCRRSAACSVTTRQSKV